MVGNKLLGELKVAKNVQDNPNKGSEGNCQNCKFIQKWLPLFNKKEKHKIIGQLDVLYWNIYI